MNITHHGLQIELDDAWWDEAGMRGFVPTRRTYRWQQPLNKENPVREVRIENVGPVNRAPGVGVFNDDAYEGITAHDRVVKILRGFRSGDVFPPIEIVEAAPGYGHRYRLVHGTHRMYCSLAAGFSHVPVVNGFDRSTVALSPQ
jgi:hypothetical protein